MDVEGDSRGRGQRQWGRQKEGRIGNEQKGGKGKEMDEWERQVVADREREGEGGKGREFGSPHY